MNIKQTFLRLTSKTYPHGTEDQLRDFLPRGCKKDLWGNYFYEIGNSKSIFACHLDTVSSKQVKVRHVFDGDYIRTDGNSILGADDKAGVVILLWMIEHNIPGTYYFFIGEEVGCVGSRAASKDIDRFKKFNKIISFDRKDTCSVITHQSWERSCSDKFADGLIAELLKGNLILKKDDGGVYTDSAEFTEIIPECTNISVGYYNEHTHNEKQNIDYLERLCEALLLVDWENLPIDRDPSKQELKSWSSSWYKKDTSYGMNSEWDDSYDDYYFNTNSTKNNKPINHLFEDDEDEEDFFANWEKQSSFTKKAFQYGVLKEKYFDDILSEEEILIIKEQYLNMNDPDDVEYLKHL